MTKDLYRLNIKVDRTVARRLKAEALHRKMHMNKLAEEILDKNLPEMIVISGKNGKEDIEAVIVEDERGTRR